MVDFQVLKDRIAEIGIRYKEDITSGIVGRTYEQLNRGIEAIVKIEEMTKELSGELNRGNVAIKGALSLAKKMKNQGDYDSESLEGLRKMYDGEKGFMKRTVSKVIGRFSGKKYPSMKEALHMIRTVAEKIPDYVNNLDNELSERREKLTSFRSELRRNIEELIPQRAPLEEKLAELGADFKTMKMEYEELEKKRLEDSEKEIASPTEVISKLDKLELYISQADEAFSTLEAKKTHLGKNIELLNSQIKKSGELLELLGSSQGTVKIAKEFVDIHVPYIIAEIKTQESEVKALSGIDRTMSFLVREDVVSRVVNERIKSATLYLVDRVNEIRQRIIENPTIYTQIEKGEKGRRIIDVHAEVIERRNYLSKQ